MGGHLRLYTSRWEGVFAAGFELGLVRRRCHALADMLLSRGWSCLVTCDTRFMANHFAREAHRVLHLRGVAASLAPTPTPLPAVQYALEQRRATCALVVSARNQPFWHNGLVLLSPQPEQIPDLPGALPPSDRPFPPSENGDPPHQDLRGPYVELLRSLVDIDLVRRTALTVFVDPMHGAGATYIPAAIGEGGQTKAIEINREADPLFGRTTPHPFGAPLTRLRKLVRESDSHAGLALSADGTTLGVVDKGGDSLDLTDLSLLLASYLARQYRQRGTVVVPLAAVQLPGLQPWQDALGLNVQLSADPAPLIAEALERGTLVLGCGTEGDITIGRAGSGPDALYAALLTAEMIARAGGSLRALLDDLRGALRGR